jgi:hypothetical protein
VSVKFEDISYDLVEGIFTILDGFIFRESDEITLTGTGGTATILNNGITKTASFHTSLIITASDFVTANAAAYLVAGTVLTSSGAKLIFKANVPGIGFTGNTTITNATGNLAGTVAAADVTYPIYKSVPKTPADTYIYIGGVIQAEDGTKDSFIYNGTVQVRVTMDDMTRADKTVLQQILNVIRGLLKATKAAVFTIGSHTLIVFSHESMTEVVEQADTGIIKVNLIDIYNFEIQ